MTVEIYFFQFKIEKPTKAHLMTKYHHFMAIGGFMASIIAGYGFPGMSNASLMCEFSSISLNYIDMFKSKKNTPAGRVNQVIFLINFTVFRIMLFPLIVYYCICNAQAEIEYVSFPRQFCMIMTCTLSILVTALQFFWYGIILRGLVKLLKDVGVV